MRIRKKYTCSKCKKSCVYTEIAQRAPYWKYPILCFMCKPEVGKELRNEQ